jgi:hypothetical protein
MQVRKIGLGLTCALLAAVAVQRARSQEHGEKSMDEMMAAWMKANAANEHHETLARMVGTWQAKSKYRPDPDAPWSESTAVSEQKMIMGGKFLIENISGEMMPGMKWEGMGITGYDNVKQKYTSAWIDSMSTAIMTSLGTIDDAKKVITFHGTVDDPMTGKRDKPVKTILRMINDGKTVVEMYEKDANGEWYKNLEVVYAK